MDSLDGRIGPDDRVVVETGGDHYHTEIWARGHELVADEPIAKGGQNHGPTAYDLLLASLGACTTITLRMYLDRKGWPVESIRVKLNHNRVHARDCEECEQEGGYIDRIERHIEITGDLDEAQKKRVLHIADRCPVHKTLVGDVFVKTTLEENEHGEGRNEQRITSNE